MTSLADARLVQDITRVIPAARAAWLYGSAARGQLQAHSDVDVAIFLTQPMPLAQHIECSTALSQAWQRDVDLVDFVRTTTVLQNQILTTGRRIFCLDPAHVDSYEAFCRTEYLNLQARRAPQLARIFATGRVLA